jgi:CubicO group peptidase (beta-lactamase class C family)
LEFGMNKIRAVMAAVLLYLAAGSVAGLPLPTTRAEERIGFDLIDAYVAAELEADRVPGGALVITNGNRIVHVRGFGEDGNGHLVTPSTSFLLGSMSKSFTALAVMQLVDQKRIELDAQAKQYLPWFRVGNAGAGDRITVRHLLNHTSGLPTMAPQAVGKNANLRAHVEALQAASLISSPGTQHEYSSPNYLVLGAIIEAVTGRSFAEYVQTEILTPIGMAHSFTSQQDAMQAGMARGHRYWFGVPVATVLPAEPGRLPTAAMIASVNDLGRFLLVQQNDGRAGGRQLLSPQALAAMHRGSIKANGFEYAMGWRVSEIYGVLAIHHGGMLPHFRGKMVMLPQEKWGVAVLTNASSALPADPTSHRIADNVAAALVGRSLPQPQGQIPRTYLIAVALMALITIAEARKLWKLRGWRQRAAKAPKKAWAGVIMGLLVSAALLFGIPAAQGLTLRASMRSAPDVTWWLIIIITVEVAISLWKATSLHFRAATPPHPDVQ